VVALEWIAPAAALVAAALAERLHARRVRRVATLLFGPSGKPSPWARAVPLLRVAAWSALAWALTLLLVRPPAKHSLDDGGATRHAGDYDHVLLVLDVSPSMRLVDAGPEKTQSRMQRARVVMESFFSRLPMERFRVSVVAVYNGALPVVVDTADAEVVGNILGDLPMHYAFQPGKTRLFDGLAEAVKIAQPWAPRSTTLVVLSDGDTIPASGMPRVPASIGEVLVVGVGDPITGKFIDGRQSRQDAATLRQLATRLSGHYHDANAKHLPSALLAAIAAESAGSPFDRLTEREYALAAAALASLLLSVFPLLLRRYGTKWHPGVVHEPAAGVTIPAVASASRGVEKLA